MPLRRPALRLGPTAGAKLAPPNGAGADTGRITVSNPGISATFGTSLYVGQDGYGELIVEEGGR